MSERRKSKELTGRHVLLMVVAFFGVVFIANGFFIYHAVNSFSGEDTPKSYRQGMNYNDILDERAEQAALGWQATTNTYEENGTWKSVVKLTDDSGQILRGLDMEGLLRHPSDVERDIPLTFIQRSDGIYEADLPVTSGEWNLKFTARRGENAFSAQAAIWLE